MMPDKASFDHILKTYTGGHGKYQFINQLLVHHVLSFASLHLNFYQFTAYAPPQRCLLPNCEPSNETKVKIILKNCNSSYQSDIIHLRCPLQFQQKISFFKAE